METPFRETPFREKPLPENYSERSLLVTFERNNPWLYWTGYYAFFIIAAIIVSFLYVRVGYPALGLADTNVTSARYLLSSIIQSEAAIIAIVISFTLVAMQLVASSYSPRVIRIFSSGNQMYVILQFYIISISYSAIFLQMLQGETGPVSPAFEYMVSFSLWSAVFLMIALIPYIRNVLTLLSPETIISLQCDKISKSSLLSSTPEPNALDLIFDIIHQSIMKSDTGLVKTQLPQVTHAVIRVLSGQLTKAEVTEITGDYSQRLTACARQSIQLDDMESSRVILENFRNLANCAISLSNDDAGNRVIESIHLLTIASADKRSWNTVTEILEILEECGIGAIDNNLEFTMERICICLRQVIHDCTDSTSPDEAFGPFYHLAERSIDSISALAHFSIADNQKVPQDIILMYLEDIGKDSWKKKHVRFVHIVGYKILELWLLAVEKSVEVDRLPGAAFDTFTSRDRWLERYKIESEFYESKIMRIGISASIHDLKKSKSGAAKLLAFFRMLDIPRYDRNMDHFYSDLEDEREREAYRQVLTLSAEYAWSGTGNT